jgi:FixJ family two-component response regulator
MSPSNSYVGNQSSLIGSVFLIEDDTELLESITEILRFVGYRVHPYSDPEEFLKQPRDVIPAVIVTDVRMPSMSGVELQAKLLGEGRKIPFVFISGESTVTQSVVAMKQGALEFLVKPFSRESLLAAVSKAIELDIQQMHALVRQSEFAQKLAALSPRERQVFGLLAKGYSNTELVNELGVALSTVKEYKSEMMYKLRLRSLSELIALNAAGETKPVTSSPASLR